MDKGMRDPKLLRARFIAEGLTISQWAAKHGFKPREVYSVLAGKTTGVRGRAHDVAVALGLKQPPRGQLWLIDPDEVSVSDKRFSSPPISEEKEKKKGEP